MDVFAIHGNSEREQVMIEHDRFQTIAEPKTTVQSFIEGLPMFLTQNQKFFLHPMLSLIDPMLGHDAARPEWPPATRER